jgi:hypothetical protein
VRATIALAGTGYTSTVETAKTCTAPEELDEASAGGADRGGSEPRATPAATIVSTSRTAPKKSHDRGKRDPDGMRAKRTYELREEVDMPDRLAIFVPDTRTTRVVQIETGGKRIGHLKPGDHDRTATSEPTISDGSVRALVRVCDTTRTATRQSAQDKHRGERLQGRDVCNDRSHRLHSQAANACSRRAFFSGH